MAIDPSIPLAAQPPASPLEMLARVQTLKNLQQQNQAGQLQLQQQQLELQDQQNFRQAYMQANGDPEKTLQIAASKGLSPKSAVAFQQQLVGLAKTRAELDDKQMDVLQKKHDAFNSLLEPVEAAAADPTTQATLFNTAKQKALAQGLITPQEFQQAQYQGPASIHALRSSLNTEKYITAQAAKIRADAQQQQSNIAGQRENREQQEFDVKKPGLIAEAAGKTRNEAAAKLGSAATAAAYTREYDKLTPELQKEFPAPELFDATKTPAQVRQLGMTAEQQTQATQEAARTAETARHNQAEEKQGAQRVSIEGGRLNLEKQRLGFETGGGVSPQAKAIAAGELDPSSTRLMLRSNPGLIGQIKSIDPKFDEANVENRYNTLKEFTSTSAGKAGGQAIALNTLVHHADLYMQAADALKNGSFRPGNAVYNAIANQFGSAPPTNAALLARFFASETGKVASGGVPAEGEINGILKSLGNNASPDQIAGAGKTLLQIAAGRATPLMERVRNAKLDNVVQVLGPDAKQILDRRGFDPETMKLKAPASGGGNYKAGDTRVINGVTYKRDANGTWTSQ